MKLISWNVNGLRAVLKKGFEEFVSEHRPDILCLQETRLGAEEAPDVLPGLPHKYYNVGQKKGYSGTSIFSRVPPDSVRMGIGKRKHDGEGRVLSADFGRFLLVNAYVPNSGQDTLGRLDYRISWDRDFRAYLSELDRKKPVILCGDLNVAHEEIDLARPQPNRKHAGFTDEEREGFRKLLAVGFVDSFRRFHPEKDQYSWWSYRAGARRKNIGWRIDYFLVSARLIDHLNDAFILRQVMGSDHCPVGITLV